MRVLDGEQVAREAEAKGERSETIRSSAIDGVIKSR